MQEVFEKMVAKLEDEYLTVCPNGEPCRYPETIGCCFDRAINRAVEIVKQEAEQYNNGWITCSEKFPPQPKENPVFDDKSLELYLVDCGEEYPFRAFWNGKCFTDGLRKIDVIAWQPLPESYQQHICVESDCPYNNDKECPAAEGCAGYQPKGE